MHIYHSANARYDLSMATNTDSKSRWLLLICAVGLVPIALSYGAVPERSLPALLGIEVSGLELTHVFRAVMGLYLGMVCLWLLGAFDDRYTTAALVSCGVFMLGLAGGRVLSLALDGMPHPVLVVYLALELAFGGLAFLVLKGRSAVK